MDGGRVALPRTTRGTHPDAVATTINEVKHMVKRVLLILAFGLAAVACNSPSSSSPGETAPALESPSAPVESPAASPS